MGSICCKSLTEQEKYLFAILILDLLFFLNMNKKNVFISSDGHLFVRVGYPQRIPIEKSLTE